MHFKREMIEKIFTEASEKILIKWNFELTVFKLTVHFKHEMIGIWQRFQRNFELQINRVRINRT